TVADLDEAVLSDLVTGELVDATTGVVVVVDKARRLVYDSTMGKVDGPALLAKGALQTAVDNAAVERAMAGTSGSVEYRHRGQEVIAGFDHVEGLDWAIVVEQRASHVLAPVRHGRTV